MPKEEEIDIFSDLVKKEKPKANKVKSNFDIDLGNILVARLVNSNVNWTRVGDKQKILKMSEIFSDNLVKMQTQTIAKKKNFANKLVSKLNSTNVDWDRFLNIPIVVKFIEDQTQEQRKLDVINAQLILRSESASKEDISRAKITLSVNKDLLNEEVQTGQNEGLIRSHTSLSAMEDHINREAEINKK